MRKKLLISKEDMLEVEKYMLEKKQAASSSEYDLLYHNLKTDQEVEQYQKENQESEDMSSSNDEPMEGDPVEDDQIQDDDAEDTPEDEEGDKSKEDDSEDEDSNEDAEESKPKDEPKEDDEDKDEVEIAKEAVSAASLLSSAKYVSSRALDISKDAVSSLYSLGVTYTPIIAKNVFKGVVYSFDKLIRLSYRSFVLVDKYIERRKNSFDNINKNIEALRKAISVLKEKEEIQEPNVKYTNTKVIDSLRIGESINLVENLDTLKSFLNTVVNKLDVAIRTDIKEARFLMANYGNRGFKLPDDFLVVKHRDMGMVQQDVEGFSYDNNLLTSYRYEETLPSNVSFIAHLPSTSLRDLESMATAYSKSKMFLGLNVSEAAKPVESIDYMNLEDMEVLLTKIEELCAICVAHQSLYENLKRTKTNVRFSIKNYFLSIAKSGNKVSLKDSLLEYVYLKFMFVDKVYLVASIDIHDYSAKVITNALSYVESNIKQLS